MDSPSQQWKMAAAKATGKTPGNYTPTQYVPHSLRHRKKSSGLWMLVMWVVIVIGVLNLLFFQEKTYDPRTLILEMNRKEMLNEIRFQREEAKYYYEVIKPQEEAEAGNTEKK